MRSPHALPQVYLAKCLRSGRSVALKVYPCLDLLVDMEQHSLLREVQIQASLNHPAIVRLFAAFQVCLGWVRGAHDAPLWAAVSGQGRGQGGS